MSRFTAIDLPKLGRLDVVEHIDFETLLQQKIDDLIRRDPNFTALYESDPAFKVLEVATYCETLIRQRVNDACLAVMLAFAQKNDLDHIGARFGVERLLLDPGDEDAIPPRPPVYEDDERFRYRIQLSLEGYSTAGPEGAYIFHALSADPKVKDVSVFSPTPGIVIVTVLSSIDQGVPDAQMLQNVEDKLSAKDVRPLTDFVTVQGAQIVTYQIDATLAYHEGPDKEVVKQKAIDETNDYIERHHRLDNTIALSGIYAALHQEGVKKVTLTNPTQDITVTHEQAAFCTGINITDE